jgi:single-stranded-DNA-specific exonuclease
VGHKFQNWNELQSETPRTLGQVQEIIQRNRKFESLSRLDYGDHGLHLVLDEIHKAILQNKRIALYADYDVDGTMSCVSWIWFFQSIGFTNYTHYIPCRFSEGYGLNLEAVKHLIHKEKSDVIITMDTGITANIEAEYCKQNNVSFICTDHHKVQSEKMPDCLILNPKLHPDESYQELCGCGITFVLLRKLGAHFEISPNAAVWTDILALTGMATICDVVPLNSVNHQLAKMGVQAIFKSKRPILVNLRESAKMTEGDEKDVGFRLGPRINAVGRLDHADIVISAFLNEDPAPLITHMNLCNERRKLIQAKIIDEAFSLAKDFSDDSILFLGGDWHPGVVGIAASKIAESFWKPTWLFQRKDGICKGSARSIHGFDVTEAMSQAKTLFTKFGGHTAAGGFSFPVEHEQEIKDLLADYAHKERAKTPGIWQSKIDFDCHIPMDLATLSLLDLLDQMKPFGHGFNEPKFAISALVSEIRYYNDKVSGVPKHTSVTVFSDNRYEKIMFFNTVLDNLDTGRLARFIVTANRNTFRGKVSLQLIGHDYEAQN